MTKLIRIQLLVFVLLTAIGASYAGIRYVGWGDGSYVVRANFAEAGGIFSDAEVTYRGVTVGRVGDLRPTADGVEIDLALREGTRVPTDTLAVVENRSAIGEQYVDLQPRAAGGPYLEDGSTIARRDTRTPLPTTKLLLDLDRLVESVPKRDLVTVLDELGAAFDGTGRDLSRLIDSGNLLIESADANLDQTIDLIESGEVVLSTQRDSSSAIRSFSRDLADLSDTVVESDQDLRTVIDEGVRTAHELQGLVEENRTDLPVLLGNLLTTGQIVRARLEGVQHILILYPYVVRGGYTVIAPDEQTGHYTAHFGLQLALGPRSCREGYDGTDKRPPEDVDDTLANTKAKCEDFLTTMRGSQNAPEPEQEGPVPPRANPPPEPDETPRSGSGSDSDGDPGGRSAEGSASYDPATGRIRLPDGSSALLGSVGGQADAFGEDSWKWLLIGPITR